MNMSMPTPPSEKLENTQQKPVLKRILPVLILLGVTAGLIILLAAIQPEAPKTERPEKAWQVQAEQVKLGPATPQLRLLGTIESPATAMMRSALNAEVASVLAFEGDYVQTGDTLIRLDDVDARLDLAQRESDVKELEAQIASEVARSASDRQALEYEKSLVALANRAVQREQKLTQSNVTSESRLDAAVQALKQQQLSMTNRQLNVSDHENRLQQLEARLDRARALRDRAAIDLARSEIKAPFTGRITRLEVSEGERLRIGDSLLEIVDTDQLEVRAQIPQKWASPARVALQEERAVIAKTQLQEHTYALRLDRISGRINSGAGGIDALFRFQDATPNLTIGRSVDILVDLPTRQDVYTLPVSAIYGANRVYKIEDERLQAVTVERLGHQFVNGQQRIIVQSEGLKDGDRVNTTQLPNAINGLKVTLRGES